MGRRENAGLGLTRSSAWNKHDTKCTTKYLRSQSREDTKNALGVCTAESEHLPGVEGTSMLVPVFAIVGRSQLSGHFGRFQPAPLMVVVVVLIISGLRFQTYGRSCKAWPKHFGPSHATWDRSNYILSLSNHLHKTYVWWEPPAVIAFNYATRVEPVFFRLMLTPYLLHDRPKSQLVI